MNKYSELVFEGIKNPCLSCIYVFCTPYKSPCKECNKNLGDKDNYKKRK
jgi:hypothetical protein